jgi:hypothetical protein
VPKIKTATASDITAEVMLNDAQYGAQRKTGPPIVSAAPLSLESPALAPSV